MKNFKDWLETRELINHKIDEVNLKQLFAAGAAGLIGLTGAKAQSPTDDYSFSGTTVYHQKSNRNLQEDEHFINSWIMHKEDIQKEMLNNNRKILSLHIEISKIDHQGKQTTVVTLKAKVTATDEITAKQIFINELMKATGKKGLQKEAIKGLQKIFQKNENTEQIYELNLKLTPTEAAWS